MRVRRQSRSQDRLKNLELGPASSILIGLPDFARAVQRSLHGPQREHCIDASDSDAIAPVTHVVHVVEAEDVGGEGSQASEDAGVAADPSVVLAEAYNRDIVQAVLEPPMAADSVSAGCGGQGDGGNEVGDL